VNAEPVHLADDGAVARIVLDRPARGHAWLRSMWGEATALVTQLAARADVRAIVLDSTGDRVFSGGADLDELESLRGDRAALAALAEDAEGFLAALEAAPQVTIAAMTGSALGAGFLIATACDVRVLSAEARVGVPAAQLGLVLSRPDVARVVRVAGPALAAELLLCARVLSAREALDHGLVARVEASARVRPAVDELAEGVARLSARSVGAMKRHLLAVSPAWDDLGGELAPSLDGLAAEDLGARIAARRRGD
jgi:enoyl-CoA hydratase/carnithine racemase